MNKIRIEILLFLSGCMLPSYAQFDVTFQRNWESHMIVSLSYIRSKPNDIRYSEYGIDIMPYREREFLTLSNVLNRKERIYSLYGCHYGYYIFIGPLLRPGVHIGTALQKKQYSVQIIENGPWHNGGYSDFKIVPYFAFSVHCGFVSFVISNIGIGAGINFRIFKNI